MLDNIFVAMVMIAFIAGSTGIVTFVWFSFELWGAVRGCIAAEWQSWSVKELRRVGTQLTLSTLAIVYACLVYRWF